MRLVTLGSRFNNTMKRLKAVIFLCTVLYASFVYGEIKTLDFSAGANSFSVFETASVELKPFKGIPYLRTTDSGTYKIILPGGITYVLEVDRGEVRSGLDEEGNATTIKLFTNKLSLEASKKLAYSFHHQFNLSTDRLDQWFVQLENGEAYSAYDGGGLDYNFPFLAMSLRTSFDKAQPAFAIFSISWDKKFSKRSGRVLSNNKELNIRYDMPELLKGVPEFTEVPEVEPVIVKVGKPEPIIDSESEPEPAIEEPSEVAPVAEPSGEPAEQSSQWWLWLIGAVVVAGGLAVVVRRKR